LNALEALKSAAIGELSEPRRAAAMTLLHDTGADDPLARQVQSLLADATNLPDPSPNRFERWGSSARAWYLALTERRWFVLAITWWFIIVGSAQLVAAVAVALDDRTVKGFVDWATIVSSAVSGTLIIVGVVRLPPSPTRGVPMVRAGILVQIFADPGVRVRARAADRRLQPRGQHPDLDRAAVDDPRRDRTQSCRARSGRFLDSARWPRRRNRASRGSRTSGRPVGTPTARTGSTGRRPASRVYAIDTPPPTVSGSLHVGTRVLLHPHRHHRPLPADARP